MYSLQIEHQVRDFSMWRQAFDSDPLDRAGSGVRSFRIYRPVGDDYVMIELDFETQEAAVMFLARLEEEVWSSGGAAAPALVGTPETRIVEIVENTTVAW
ncbi:hypothetical protein [Arthrobacter crystallopoietes]|uniref:Antibiotic biosynthesis monooxygenase n=1 Tax=Crystallibacter crystallopoietes TaxID=37928 RepID=A0A1H0ZP84_9MICC|nr:hypothetical protein [Arthrobacter crystallopoietes]AUI51881.1 hypothetical protein AC20117_14870 [Arthrobacter crystallopoietes]SDQ29243.1 hypothetical protein SAMN04489742_0484 [Arthrobacter crystallopoietes]